MYNLSVEYKILVVDDDKSNRQILTLLLAELGQVILASTGQEAMQKACQQQPDIVILDILLPDLSGYELINALKSEERTQHIPLIVVSASDSYEAEEKALLSGAVDYIKKPFHASILKARVNVNLKNISQRRMFEKLTHLDALTGIPNYAQIEELFNKIQHKCANDEKLLLAVVDIDDLARYNKLQGRHAGDRVLRLVAHALAGRLMMFNGHLVRLYDATFAIIMACCDESEAESVLSQLLKSVRLLELPVDETGNRSVSVSVGACLRSNTGQSTDVFRMLKFAHTSLQAAKNQGRNCFVLEQTKID
ncbi:response regulator [Gayadomonas joobiniege]|uniref:GGDEF domain-containing response regulator n=1 Tax=Gayadomonas joobiniege TaxID=1234606 RepID=UPI000361A089|nr:response regulator [Gayadomonas joobiniege]